MTNRRPTIFLLRALMARFFKGSSCLLIAYAFPSVTAFSMLVAANFSYSEETSEQLLESELSKKEAPQSAEHDCDPLVDFSVDNKSMSSVLTDLSEAYGFTLHMEKPPSQKISIEKKQKLSKLLESITRKMNVVFEYGVRDGCQSVFLLALINDKDWAKSRSLSSLERQRMVPGSGSTLKAVPKNERSISPDRIEKQRLAKEAAKKRLEEKVEQGYINLSEGLDDEEGSGPNIITKNPDYYQAPEPSEDDPYNANERQLSYEPIEDMDTYVREVLDGGRVPDIKSMSLSDRAKYMRVRRQIRREELRNSN